jgi:hypothetical protein
MSSYKHVFLFVLLAAFSLSIELNTPASQGYVLSGNVVTTNYSKGISVNGTVSANKFIGDGSGLAGVLTSVSDNLILRSITTSGNTLTVNAMDGYDIWPGNSIVIKSGSGTNMPSTRGGSLSFFGGNGNTSGGIVNISSGTGVVDGGDMNISAGLTSGTAGTYTELGGNVNIIAGNTSNNGDNRTAGSINLMPGYSQLGGIGATTQGTINLSGNTTAVELKVGTSNNTIFDSSGFMVVTGSAMAWDDVGYQQILPIKDTGGGSLTLATITGNITGWVFQVNDYVPMSMEMSHRWKIGSPLSIHMHMLTKSTNEADRFVKWQIEYCWVDINGAVTSPLTISNNVTIAGGTSINTHIYVELGEIAMPPLSMVSGHLLGKLTRVTATGTAVDVDPIGLSIGVHGRIDSLGSRGEYVK